MIKNIKWVTIPLLSAFIYFLPEQANAQGGGNPDPATRLAVASPTASAMVKYTDFPVSSYTYTPDISFPLYTISTAFTNVPITLSYHAGGIWFDVGRN